MANHSIQTSRNPQWKTKALVVGAVLGVCVGVAATYIFIQNYEEDGAPAITAGEGVKLGVLVLGLLRSIATLGEGK